MPDADPSRLATPTAQAIGRDTLAFLIRELIADVKALGPRLDRLEEGQARSLEALQRAVTLELKSKLLGRRVAKLEDVVYEGGDRPDMQGPPERRRPVLPSRPGVDDSGIHDLERLTAQLNELQRHHDKQDRRESWMVKERYRLRNQVVGGVVIAMIVALVTWLAAHASIHS